MKPMRNTDTPKAPIQDAYELHDDRGMIYNPLSRDVDKAELMAKYENANWYEGSLKTENGNEISFRLPTSCTAYDMVPVEYEFKSASCFETVHFMATGLEDKTRKPKNVTAIFCPAILT